MRKTLLNAILFLFAATGFANAQSETLSHSVGLTATVPTACSFDSGPVSSGPALVVSSGTNSTFTVEIDPATAKVIPSNASLTFANAFCNTASTIALSRSGLTTTGTTTEDFSASINYSADVSWGSASIGLGLGASNTNSTSVGPLSGDLNLEIFVPADGRLLPGVYNDTLTLNVTPNS